jgi:hypothetical protein
MVAWKKGIVVLRRLWAGEASLLARRRRAVLQVSFADLNAATTASAAQRRAEEARAVRVVRAAVLCLSRGRVCACVQRTATACAFECMLACGGHLRIK